MTEENKLNIYQKIQKARVELQNSKLKKSGKNDFSKYEYFELGDFLPNINKICDELGLCNIFNFTSEKATLTIFDTEDIESKLEFSTPVELASLKGCSDIQNIGGTQTYCRRYLYIMAYEIAENDVLDSGEKEIDEGVLKIDETKVKSIRKILVETDSNIEEFLKWAKVKRINDITNRNFAIVMQQLNKKQKEYEEMKKQVTPVDIDQEQFEF